MNKVLARLTVTRKNSTKAIIVEVHQDATFKSFYKWYSKEGRKRKKLMRTSHRGDGVGAHYREAFQSPGLHLLAERLEKTLPDFSKATINIFRKREYQRVLTVAADELGSLPRYESRIAQGERPRWERRPNQPIPVQLPVGYITLQDRMDIMTGVKR